MNNLNWYLVYVLYLDVSDVHEESALKAGYDKVVFRPDADKVIARQQYLRCLDIAQWCLCKSEVYGLYARHTDCIPNIEKYRRKRDHYADRCKKLLGLAEKLRSINVHRSR